MGFLEHVGQSLASLQPWREFPPGHPRHGEVLDMQVLRWLGDPGKWLVGID